MKYKLLIVCAASLSLFLSQCSESPTIGEENNDLTKSIKIAIAIPPGISKTISNAVVDISADDMKAIRKNLAVNDSSITGVIHNIPAGNDRHFEVSVFGSDRKTVLYYGDTYANIYAGQETYLKIILRQPGGTAIIDGYIEGYEPPLNDTLYPPSTPYIYNYELTTSNPPRCFSLSLATDGSVFADSLYYIWEVFRFQNYDTIYNTYLLGQVLTLEYPKDGQYEVHVSAHRMYGDTSENSPPSYPLNFSIQNGLLVGSIRSDKILPVISLTGPYTIFLKPGESFNEQGYRAYDNVDGDITSKVVIDTTYENMPPGIMYIIYSVRDAAGNENTAVRMVYMEKSTLPSPNVPTITSSSRSNDPFIAVTFSTSYAQQAISNYVYEWVLIDVSDSSNICTRRNTGENILNHPLIDNKSYTAKVRYVNLNDTSLVTKFSENLNFKIVNGKTIISDR
jgi:hypothetical protein